MDDCATMMTCLFYECFGGGKFINPFLKADGSVVGAVRVAGNAPGVAFGGGNFIPEDEKSEGIDETDELVLEGCTCECMDEGNDVDDDAPNDSLNDSNCESSPDANSSSSESGGASSS